MSIEFTKETIDEFKQNNKKISELLERNEELIKTLVPHNTFSKAVVDSVDRIKYPSSMFRTCDSIIIEKHLNVIIRNDILRKNIGYSYQLADWYAYVLNRFFTWGSIQTMVLKNTVINLISIFEATVLECAHNICCNPSECGCKSVDDCNYKFNKDERNNIMKAVKRINGLNITDFTEDELSRIQEFVNFRNHVHIELGEENEFIAQGFTIALYNEIVQYLARLNECIYKNGVPLYDLNCHKKM